MAKFLKAKVVFTLAESEYGSEHEDTVLHTFSTDLQAIAFLHSSWNPVGFVFDELRDLTNVENYDILTLLHEEYDKLPKELKEL